MCDAATIRRGAVFLADLSGFGWKQFSIKGEEKATAIFTEAYPAKLKSFVCINAGWLLWVLLKMCLFL